MKPTQLVRLIALLSSIAGAASAQTAPPPAPAAAAPAAPTAPAPAVAPAAPAPGPFIEPPLPASAVVPPPESTYQEEAPPPPAPPSGSSRNERGHFLIGAAWDVALPVASVRQFTDSVSGLGFEFLVRYFALPQLSIGASTDFQTFIANRPRTTYQIDNGAVTATAYNSVQNTAVRASAHYYFLDDGPALPYVGASVGIGWSTFQTAAADLVIYDNQTSILLGGDVGALFPLANSSMAFLTAIRYSALPAADFLKVTDVQSVSLQFGISTR
ncbi:MAG: hypothetical protein WDO69_00870 [Pseudomonadota bacterium]